MKLLEQERCLERGIALMEEMEHEYRCCLFSSSDAPLGTRAIIVSIRRPYSLLSSTLLVDFSDILEIKQAQMPRFLTAALEKGRDDLLVMLRNMNVFNLSCLEWAKLYS